ncbi:MAG: hypothetical protein US98_C0012G0006 [Parcubacteria group bacterium GW2011_GWC1_38_6]|nr:MAG: hypothetical protein US98_C0012G0006 [Parcubacteria group bacterium GW2011_GWC1_38_6]
MKFAIIGKGFIFPSHEKAIKAVGGKIVDIVDEKTDGPDAWKSMVKKTTADCVVVLTPNDLHFEMVKLALEQEKIVLCEKPLVTKLEQAKILANEDKIFTVLQLRHHPLVELIKKEQFSKKGKHIINMNIFFKRNDEDYINGWKNQKNRSGGFLYNVGIHYFDLLLYLFGDAQRVKVDKVYEDNGSNPKAEAKGVIEGINFICNWQIFINKKEDGDIVKKREYIINGTPYNFSSKDNLAQENLHKFTYEDLLKGKGVKPKETLRSIELVEEIYMT